MELINNKNKLLKVDLVAELQKGSKVAEAAHCFSIYVKRADIKCIGISPTLKDFPARGGVSSLVKEYDLSCDIYESDIPLRNN